MDETRFHRVTLSEFRLFLTVCDTESFTLAGARLGLSQPGVSRVIRQLEKRTGLRLFDRTGRGVTLTEAGELLRVYTEEQFVSLGNLEAALDRLSGAHPDEIQMVLPMRVGRLLIPPLIKAAAARWPKVSLRIHEEVPAKIPMRVHDADFDFGIAYEAGIGSAHMSEKLANEALVLVGNSDLMKGCSDPIPLSEVAELPLNLSGQRTPYRHLIDKTFRSVGLSPKINREIETADALLAFAAEGEGGTILPLSTVYQEIDQGMAVARLIVQPEINRSIWFLVSPKRKSEFADEVLRLVKGVIRECKGTAHWS